MKCRSDLALALRLSATVEEEGAHVNHGQCCSREEKSESYGKRDRLDHSRGARKWPDADIAVGKAPGGGCVVN